MSVPMPPTDPAEPSATRPATTRAAWLGFACLGLLLLAFAAWRPLTLPDEGRYAEIGRWMLQSGDRITPRVNGIPFFHKPPLLYWLEADSIALFGVTPLAVRVPVVAHALLMLVALYLFARAIVAEAVARRAAWMFGTSLAFLAAGQYVNHDTLVACWIGIAIACFARACGPGGTVDAVWARLGFAACALGVLSKGLIGLALPGLVLAAWLIWDAPRDVPRWLARLPWLSGLAIFLALTAPWFWLAEREYPGMLAYLFGTQHLARYTAAGFNNARPWWFYLAAIALLSLPWGLLALVEGVRGLRAPLALPARWWRLCVAWVIAILVFFSVPRSKIVGYILPVMPAIALLAAAGWERLRLASRWRGIAWGAGVTLALALAVAANGYAERQGRRDGTGAIADALMARWQPGERVYVSGDYPYDLPFLANYPEQLIVIDDWVAVRLSGVDNWLTEMLDGAGFDPEAGEALQYPGALDAESSSASSWLLLPRHDEADDDWILVAETPAWALYRSPVSGGVAAPARP